MRVFASILGAFILAVSLVAPSSAASEGSVAVMLHICPENIRSQADFDALGGFLQKVLACPVITRVGDEGPAGSVSAANQNFDFAVQGGNGPARTIADAKFMAAKLCESDLDTDVNGDGKKSADTCVNISHYVYSGIPKGNVKVTERTPPSGFQFGSLEFSPAALDNNNDADTLKRFGNGVIELDTTRDKDDSVMLHVYNFRAGAAMHGGGHTGAGQQPTRPKKAGPSKVRTLTVKLEEERNSGVTGTAVLNDNGNGTTTVRVQIQGGNLNIPRPEHLHDGTCKGTVPSVRYPLENVVGGKAESIVPASLDQLLSEKLFINVHTKVSKVYTLSPVIACGDLAAPKALGDPPAQDRRALHHVPRRPGHARAEAAA